MKLDEKICVIFHIGKQIFSYVERQKWILGEKGAKLL